jgi:hypothetical protein
LEYYANGAIMDFVDLFRKNRTRLVFHLADDRRTNEELIGGIDHLVIGKHVVKFASKQWTDTTVKVRWEDLKKIEINIKDGSIKSIHVTIGRAEVHFNNNNDDGLDL